MKQLKDIVLTGFLALLAFTACTEEKLIDERPMETGTVSISFSTEGVETKEWICMAKPPLVICPQNTISGGALQSTGVQFFCRSFNRRLMGKNRCNHCAPNRASGARISLGEPPRADRAELQ